MATVRIVYQLMLADFLERARRSSFLITLGSMVLLGYYFLPARSANYVVLSFEGHRGIYNSAWVGSAVAILASLWLSLVGFFLVKNTLERDLRTGTGQIIATTPVRRPLYTLPTLAIVSAVAILFETIEWLRSGLGNIVYAALWAATVVATVVSVAATKHSSAALDDVTGSLLPLAQMQAAVKAAFPRYGGEVTIGPDIKVGPLQIFTWSGM